MPFLVYVPTTVEPGVIDVMVTGPNATRSPDANDDRSVSSSESPRDGAFGRGECHRLRAHHGALG